MPGLEDYQIAQSLSPENSTISKDCKTLTTLLNISTKKDMADELFKIAKFDEALKTYNQVFCFHLLNCEVDCS